MLKFRIPVFVCRLAEKGKSNKSNVVSNFFFVVKKVCFEKLKKMRIFALSIYIA